MRGRFIVFEGIDGAGKSTQMLLLKEHLEKEGRKVKITAEPTQSVTGGALRDALSGNFKRTQTELAAMFLSDRVFHNNDPYAGIVQALEKGYDVLCDRYYYSSFAYQGLDTSLKWVMDMNLNCPDITRPDLCIFLDLDAEKSRRRIEKSRTETEIFENSETLGKIRNKFFEIFDILKDENIAVVDASGTVSDIAEKIYQRVSLLKRED